MPLDLVSQPLIDQPDVKSKVADGVFGPYGQQALAMAEQGFCFLDLADDPFRQLAHSIRACLENQFDLQGWRHGVTLDLRLQSGWKQCAAVRQLALHSLVLEALRYLYGREPFCFQTLNSPVGSQQHIHSDAVYCHGYPHGYMCGVWIALEDIEADAGPLFYYPGSHRLPYRSAQTEGFAPATVAAEPYTQRLFEPIWLEEVERHGLQAEAYLPRQGQAMVWHANLLHGGLPVNNRERTRWSQVNHYFFADCLYTTPMQSFDYAAGGPSLRRPKDVATGRPRWGSLHGIMLPSQ